MAIRKYVLNEDQQLTEEQTRMVREAAKRPVVVDDDTPELTDEQLSFFHRVHEDRQTDRRRQNVTLRLTPQAIRKAKSLGKGYTGEKASAELFRRTGIANGTVDFPKDFDEHFDDLNEEIAVMFYQEEKDKRGGTLYDG